jgi:hypothetical protein
LGARSSTYLDGKEWRVSTNADSLALAKEFAEWHDDVMMGILDREFSMSLR